MSKVINGGRGMSASDSKTKKKKDIFADIAAYDKQTDTKHWEGTLKEYIALVQDKPKLAQLAHSRVLDMVESHGVEYDEDDKNKEFPVYKFFEEDLFGVDEAIRKVMRYLKAAASGSQVGRRILLLYGPTSSGKSQLVTLLKAGLEQWSRTEEGTLYALKGSPMHENPLNAVPVGLRKKFREEYGIKIDPDAKLSPYMQVVLDEEYDGKWLDLPVERVFISEAARLGIGTFLPGDTKNQSITELVGSVDYSKLSEFGVESDPRAYKFDGELNVANRGMMEMIEMLKVDPKFLYVLLTLAQEKTIKTERFPLIYADEFIIAHTNETEFTKFLGDTKMEALHDRIIVVKCPYNLILDEEEKIYEKLVNEADFGDVHIAPLTLRAASMFAVLSRMEEPKDASLTLLKKMRLYNGEAVDGFTAEEIKSIKAATEREGMVGVSPRYIFNCIADCFTKSELSSITPIEVLRSIKNNFPSSAKFKPEDIERFDELLMIVIEEYTKLAKNEVQKAFFVNFNDEIDNLLNNYVDNVGAFLDKTTVKDEFGEFHEPNENIMRSIEEKVGVSTAAAESFRREVYRKVLKSKAETGKFDYRSHAKLREALEQQLFDERSDVIRLTVTTRNPDPEAIKKLNSVINTLCEKHGYTPDSANQLLRFVNSIMAKQ